MAAVDQQTIEIMAAFQQHVKSQYLSEISRYTLHDLKRADEVLGSRDLNDSFRIALRNRIKELEGQGEKKYQSHVRVIGYIVMFVLGVLATRLADWLVK